MKHFITALQFLTRIPVSQKQQWQMESFGKSVKFFPLVGAVIGFFLAMLALLGANYLPSQVLAALIVTGWIFLTGGLHCDGLMDTADGVFSGKERDKMLEIMKDSRVGANGVVAFGIVLILKFSLLAQLPSSVLPYALFTAPVAGRLVMSLSIILFPYARAEGMGKAFAQFAGKTTGLIATFFAILIIVPLGEIAFFSGLSGVLAALFLSLRLNKTLGGLTGDCYGAVTECCEVLVLFFFLLLSLYIP